MSVFLKDCLSRHAYPFKTSQALQIFLSQRTTAGLKSQPRFYATDKLRLKGKTSGPMPLNFKRRAPVKPVLISSTPKPAPSSISRLLPLRPAGAGFPTLASTLARKAEPTLLYQAPSLIVFKVACYTSASFCFAYAAFCVQTNVLDPPPDLAPWVSYAFAGISLFMAGFGSYLFLGPARIIKTISAVPKHLASSTGVVTRSAGPGAAAAAPTLGVGQQGEILLEIELGKMLPVPFFPVRRILARPAEVEFEQKLSPPLPGSLSTEQRNAKRVAELAAWKKAREYDMNHIMTIPFRHMKQGAGEFFRAISRMWSREGFIKVSVKGHRYKLDGTAGWALEGGRSLDKLVTFKPNKLEWVDHLK